MLALFCVMLLFNILCIYILCISVQCLHFILNKSIPMQVYTVYVYLVCTKQFMVIRKNFVKQKMYCTGFICIYFVLVKVVIIVKVTIIYFFRNK